MQVSDTKMIVNENPQHEAKQTEENKAVNPQDTVYKKEKIGRQVFYMINLRNVFRIDLPKQTFHASLTFDFRWYPSPEELASGLIDKDGNLTRQPEFQPVDNFYEKMNALSDNLKWEFDVVEVRTIREVGKDLFLAQRLWVSGEFFSNFDLRTYPCDTQSLTIGFKIRKSHMDLVPISFGGMKFFKVTEHVFSKAYFYANAMIEHGVPSQTEKTRGTASYYYIYVTMKVIRNPLDFVLRHCSWLFLFSFSTFGVFTMNYEDIADRMMYLITIILIFSAYSIVLSGELPEVPYYTYGDHIIMCHTAFVTIANVLIGIGSPEVLDFDEEKQKAICIALFVIWLGYNMAWFFRIYMLQRVAPVHAQKFHTGSHGHANLIATSGVVSGKKKGGMSLYSIYQIESPMWT